MEIIDDRTMIFHLDGPYGNFPSVLAGAVGMVMDPIAFEEMGEQAFAADPGPSGAGPYRVARYVPGEETILEAREDYWDGPVCIETLRFVRIIGEEARLETFLNEELDMTYVRSPQVFAELRQQEFSLHTHFSNGGNMIGINSGTHGTDPPGSDPRIRQAIAYAIDPKVIDERAFDGEGVPDTAIVSESSIHYTEGIEGPPYDLERARQLLEEVKAETGYDGSITFSCHNAAEYVEQAIAIEAMLEAVGFTVELDNQQTLNDYLPKFEVGDYELSCFSLGSFDARPWETMTTSLAGGGASRLGYSNPEMDKAMRRLKEALTRQERQEAIRQIQQVWNETIPSAIYAHVEEGAAWHDNVTGLEFTNDGIIFFDEARILE